MKIFISWFVLHVIGLIYSTDIIYGMNDIQTKLSFLIVPFVFCALDITSETYLKIRNAFIISCLLSFLLLLILSFQKYLSSHDSSEFFYTGLSHDKHATYLTIYFNLALLFIQQKYFDYKKSDNRLFFLIAFFFLFIGILLLSSRTSTILAIISISVYPFIAHRERLKSFGNNLIHGSCIILMLFLFFSFLKFNNRFLQVEQEIVTQEYSHGEIIHENPNSTNIRLNLWKNAVELISRHPLFGVGTGDIKPELVKIYTENNYDYGIRERISPHNQFLHTGVILGLTGILLLLCYFIFPAGISYKNRDWLYLFFLAIIFFNCMTESLLERQAGILFFTAFNSCFYLRLRKEMK